MASIATLKYGPNILIAHGTTKGGGGGFAGPLSRKRLLKSIFFGPPPLQGATDEVAINVVPTLHIRSASMMMTAVMIMITMMTRTMMMMLKEGDNS